MAGADDEASVVVAVLFKFDDCDALFSKLADVDAELFSEVDGVLIKLIWKIKKIWKKSFCLN